MQNASPAETGNQVIDLLNQLETTANQLTRELHALGAVGIWEVVRRRAEKGAAIAMLDITNGNISEAALRLQVNRNTLGKRADYFGIDVEAIRGGAA